MSKRFLGGIISATPPTVSTSSAPGVWSLEQALQYIKAGTWPVAITSDPYFKYVTMLLHGDGTNGAQNNTFLDSSTNNFSITRNGNTTQGSFSPYGSNWSNYFSGTSDYISVPSNAAFQFGTGDFTIECWFFDAGTSDDYPGIISSANGWQAGSTALRFNNLGNRKFGFFHNPTGDPIFSSTNTFSSYQWYHVAVSRSGSSLKMFVNGVQEASATVTASISLDTTTGVRIGSGFDVSSKIKGYVSNVRVVKGTAVYTGNFTPSTTPLTAISGTSLLTCQSNRFVDNSTNNFTITVNGDTSVQRFSPFSPSAAYSTSVIGGSGYFDGSGDYLNLNGQSAFAFGSSADFTIQFWFYANAISADVVFYDGRPTTTQGAYPTIYLNGTTKVVSYVTSNAERITGTTTITTGQWYYVTLSRNSGVTRLFVNGVQQGSNYSDTINYANPASRPTIMQSGYAANGYLNGYVSDFQVLNGTGYSSVTVPTAPLTAITNTSLLLNYTNGGIFDNAMMNNLETVGNAQISTSVVKFGTGSMAFDGSGDWLIGKSTPVASFETGDFTLEGWLYPTVVTGTDRCIWDTRAVSVDTGMVLFINSTGNLSTYTSSSIRITSTGTLTANTWQHFALVRSGGTLAFYINGTQSGTLSYSTTITCPGRISIGVRFDDASPYTGYIDDLRITKGYARYTSNFTPPTAAFQNN